MTVSAHDTIALTQALVRCPSVTPHEAGALTLLGDVLQPLGFECHRLVFSETGFPDVDNLFARIGAGPRHLCFAGHTDVVPPGDEASWTHGPFSGDIADGFLWGRGSVDMKGNIAAFVAAAAGWLQAGGQGSISLLITGDEEADAVNGTVKVLDWMARNGHTPTDCIVGEPSCSEALGDTIRIGRRGSLSCKAVFTGTQGHVGYAHKASNPVKGFVRFAHALQSAPLDAGTEHFVASNLEIVSVDVGNPVYNVIPARIEAKLNIRYNDTWTRERLEAHIRKAADEAVAGSGLGAELIFSGNADVFVTRPGPLVDLAEGVLRRMTNGTPALSTAGGTSDARFVKDHCPVIELGLVNKGIHAVDEKVPVADLVRLTEIYRAFIERYFG
jgi:succinyl-diaminopimelate desuccinylase